MTKVIENQQVNMPNIIQINSIISLKLKQIKTEGSERYEYLR